MTIDELEQGMLKLIEDTVTVSAVEKRIAPDLQDGYETAAATGCILVRYLRSTYEAVSGGRFAKRTVQFEIDCGARSQAMENQQVGVREIAQEVMEKTAWKKIPGSPFMVSPAEDIALGVQVGAHWHRVTLNATATLSL